MAPSLVVYAPIMNPTSLDDNIIYQIAEFDKRFSERLNEVFKAASHDVTGEQFTVLVVLWYEDGIPQKELANRIGRDKTTISRLVDNMIKRQLIVRAKGEDRRVRLIKLTEKGRSLQHQLVGLSGTMYTETMAGVDQQDLDVVLRVLNQMRMNLK